MTRLCFAPIAQIAPIAPLCAAIALALAAAAHADDTANTASAASAATPQELQPSVVQATALPGTAIDADKIPANVQILRAADLSRDGSASLTRALDSQLGSININDNLDDPFQPDILYRGFEASPVLGTPQGLAVYQNGVRINEAFGDTVNWDLFPDLAINRVDLVSSNPVYGLNALGGAVSVSMKNGFNYQGADVALSDGSFGHRAAQAQYGDHWGQFGFYIAGDAQYEKGWRQFSTDNVRQLYTAASARSDHGSLELSFTYADNSLNGQGSAPVQELAVDRSLVFTGPQLNRDRLDFLTLNGSYDLTSAWSLQSVLYYRKYRQDVLNGNTTDYTACSNGNGFLCQPDGTTVLTSAAGAPLPDISQGGTVVIGENDVETIAANGRGFALQSSDSQPIFDHGNQFSAGASLDFAIVEFDSAAQVGAINSQRLVLPSNLIVDTPEAAQNAALAAGDPDVTAQPVALHSTNRVYGLYATDTFDVAPTVSLTASARYNIAFIDLQDDLGANLTGNNRYSHFNPAFGGTYRVVPTVTAYAGFSENTRTPTASEIECSNPLQPCLLPSNLAGDPPTLRQVVAHTTELGVRGNAPDAAGSGRITWNASIFRTRLYDDIYGIATSVSEGFFQNIGQTRRQGLEAGVQYQAPRWATFLNYSDVDATFQSPLTLPSPSSPFQDANGNIQVLPGDHLPGIPRHRLKAGVDCMVLAGWTVGGTVKFVGSSYYYGDESNQLAPLPSYRVVELHTSYRPGKTFEFFASVNNLLNARYANYGILSDPTGVGAPGIPANGVTNGPGVDNRFQSPAAPIAVTAGVRIGF